MAHRKHSTRRRGGRRGRRGGRGGRGGKRGLFGYLYNPIHHTLGAANNVTNATATTFKNIVRNGLKGVNKVGSNVTRRANNIVNGLIMRKKSRKHRR